MCGTVGCGTCLSLVGRENANFMRNAAKIQQLRLIVIKQRHRAAKRIFSQTGAGHGWLRPTVSMAALTPPAIPSPCTEGEGRGQTGRRLRENPSRTRGKGLRVWGAMPSPCARGEEPEARGMEGMALAFSPRAGRRRSVRPLPRLPMDCLLPRVGNSNRQEADLHGEVARRGRRCPDVTCPAGADEGRVRSRRDRAYCLV